MDMNERTKRIISTVLALCLMLQYIPAAALAEDTAQPGLCDHHNEHIGCAYASNGICGYVCVDCAQQEETTSEDTVPAETEQDGAEQTEPVPEPAAETTPKTVQAADEDWGTVAAYIPGGSCGYTTQWSWLDNTLTISGTGATYDYGSIGTSPVPWSGYTVKKLIVEEGVTSLGNRVFDGRTELETVELADTVTGLGYWAFRGCTALESIVLPESLRSIGDGAFEDCTNLRTVTLSGGMTRIESDTFSGCSSLQEITLPNTLTEIKNSAFAGCSALKSIVIPEGVRYIYAQSFENCTSLESISLPSTLAKNAFGTDAFAGCTKLKKVNIADLAGWCAMDFSDYCNEEGNPLHNGAALYVNDVLVEHLVIPEDMQIYGSYNFTGCSSIKTVTIPGTVRGINYAFQNCSSIQEIYFMGSAPDFITSRAFEGVTATVYYPGADSSWADMEGNYGGNLTWEPVFYKLAEGSCGSAITWLLYDNGILELHGTGAMPDYTASGAPWQEYKSLITDVIVGEGITSIGNHAFYQCENLSSLSVSSTVTTVGAYAFCRCTVLQQISGTSGITSVYDYAFAYCEMLPGLPEAELGWVGSWAFAYCSNLTQMNLQPSMTNTAFGEGAFYDCTSLEQITIPTSVNVIPRAAFGGCAALKTVDAHSRIVTISSGAFRDCTSLTDFEIPGWVTHIYSNAFANSGLTAVSVSGNVEYIAPGAFAGCKNLAKFEADRYNTTYKTFDGVLFTGNGSAVHTYPAGASGAVEIPYTGYAVTDIGQYAFAGCSGITQITLPTVCTGIGSCAFLDCTGLTSFSTKATSIGNLAFSGCTNLQTVKFTGEITALNNALFDGCTGLEAITIPASVKTMDTLVFSGCTNLKEITFKGYLPTMKETTFSDVTATCYYAYFSDKNNTDNYGGELTWVYAACKDGHSIVIDQAVDATCTKDGLTRGEHCSRCNEILTAQEVVKAPGHNMVVDEAVLPTCTADGLTQGEHCSRCNEVSVPQTVIPATGHSYVDAYCTVCGAKETFGGQIGGSSLNWYLDEEDVLTISGEGGMPAFDDISYRPWNDCRSRVTSLVIEDGVTVISDIAFRDMENLQSVVMADSVTILSGSAFTGCRSLTDVDLSDNLEILADWAFGNCTALTAVTIPDSVTCIGGYAFRNCPALAEIRIPENVETIGENAFYLCSGLKKVTFTGSAPEINTRAFTDVAATVFYPWTDASWTEEKLQKYGGYLNWVPYGCGENQVIIPDEESARVSVWIDGREYGIKNDRGVYYVDLPHSSAKTMVFHTYGESGGKQYPSGMKVWTLENENGIYTAVRQEALDDLLQYEGCSIRIKGKQGIRMITSIDETNKKALTGSGLAGYTLKEYGTAVAWAGQLGDTDALVLGMPNVKHNYAYSRAMGADPVFDHQKGRMQYTNVLVGFSLSRCDEDLAMRPYMILEDLSGNEITIYGGIVERSIGHIASEIQKQGYYPAGSEAYEYLQKIIDAVSAEN